MADLICTVTASTNFTEDDAISADQLNLAAAPVVTIPEGTIQPEHIDTDALVTDIGDVLRGTNYLPWGSFQQQLLNPLSPLACAAAYKTYVLPNWWVTPTGGEITATFKPLISLTADSDDSRSSIKLAQTLSNITLLHVGTWLPSGLCQQIADGSATFSIWVRNNTGTTFTPSLLVYTAATADDPSSIALAETVTGTSVADGEWVRQSYTFDPTGGGGYADWANGAMLVLSITGGGGVFGASGENVLLSDAQLEPGTAETDYIRVPPALPQVPPGTMFPYAGATTPPGWLLCDGTLVAKAQYPALYAAIGDAYGVSGGSFNVPDLRGRVPLGKNAASISPERMDMAMSATGTSGQYTLTVTSTAGLRTGMGAFGTNIGTSAVITGLTATVITLDTVHTDTVNGTVYFSKLGAADARTLGATGTGMSGGRRIRKLVLPGSASVTSGSAVLTPAGASETIKQGLIAEIMPGMLIDDGASGANIPVGTTVLGFQFLSGASTEIGRIIMSANASNSSSALSVTCYMDDPEGDDAALTALKNDQITLYGCNYSSGTTQLDVGHITRLRVGMRVTGTNITVGTYIAALSAGAPDYVTLSANTTGTGSNAAVTFSGSDEARAATAQTPDTLPALVFNWIIKT